MATSPKESSQIKSKERVAERGEVFTAEKEVNAMLDLVANECLRPDSRFLEPACGDGNFLAAILRRKLAELRRKYKKSPRNYEKLSIVAIGSLYGVDIMNDNVIVCVNAYTQFGTRSIQTIVRLKPQTKHDKLERRQHSWQSDGNRLGW